MAELLKCDQCEKTIPNKQSAAIGWWRLTYSGGDGKDLCSLECVGRYAEQKLRARDEEARRFASLGPVQL